MAKRDYYEILGVSKNASADDIRSAHRRLVRKYHPDVNKNDAAADAKFKEVQEAYDALSDVEKRRTYDEFGHGGPIPNNPYAGAAAGGGPWRGDGGSHVEEIDPSDFNGGQFSDIFESMFGARGAFNRGRGARAQPSPEDFMGGMGGGGPAPAAPEYPVKLTFEQAARGTTLPLTIQRGQRTETIDVKIPSGVKTGSRVRLKGRGQPGPGGPGDLFVVVQMQDHAYFRRDGLDILLDVPVSVYEAMLGATVTVPTLDGRKTITVPPGTNSGAKLRLRGEGVKRGADVGDQLCILKVVVPKHLDETAAAAIELVRQKHPIDARADVAWR